MKEPSTAWREVIPADEAQHFERVARAIAKLQRVKSARFGSGRALHRKKLLTLAGVLEVLPDLPAYARHGLFATPGRHPALVRLSNGGPDVQANKQPDIRGFALKVLDVAGPGALGGPTDHQDFLMINHDRLTTPDSREFVAFIEALTRGTLPAVLHLFSAHGLAGGWRRTLGLFATLAKKFGGFASERFNTVLPHSVGPYAARVRLKPSTPQAPRAAKKDIVQDVRDRLSAGPLVWDLELQFFVDETSTPIEDATRAWPDAETPIVTVARLTLTGETGDEVEAQKFDPWSGLKAHRPLGEIMRARKVAYFTSQKGRAPAGATA